MVAMRSIPLFALLLWLLVTCSIPRADREGPETPNLLFIAVDDLNTDLHCMGSPVQSPCIDRLASEGILFSRHYVQFAVCIPSRVALLTGMRPERTHQRYGPEVWQKVPGARSWGDAFREGGYESISLGKIWHWPGAGHPDTFHLRWNPSPYNINADPENNRKLANQHSGKNRDTSLEPVRRTGDRRSAL